MSSPEDNLAILLHEKHTSSYAKCCMRPSLSGYIWYKGTMWHVMSVTKHQRCSEVVLIAKKGYIVCQRRTCPKFCVKKRRRTTGHALLQLRHNATCPLYGVEHSVGARVCQLWTPLDFQQCFHFLSNSIIIFLVLNQHAARCYSDCCTGTGLLLQMTNIETHVQETHIQLLHI